MNEPKSHQQLQEEKEQLLQEIEQLNKDIAQIKKENAEGINIDERMNDLIQMKSYLKQVKENNDLKKIYAKGSKMKKEKKGNYSKTLKRQQSKIEKEDDNEAYYNVIEIRKQYIIDSIARQIEKIAREEDEDSNKDQTNSNEILSKKKEEEIANILNSLEEQLDTDCRVTDVNSLLKTFDVNAIALRKTSTVFKVTSRLFSLQTIVDETSIADEEESQRVTECEKTTFNEITQKVADLAVAMEDAISLSAVMLGKPHDDYSGEFFDICSQVIINVSEFANNSINLIQRLSELKKDDDIIKKYQDGLEDYYKIIKSIIDQEREPSIKKLIGENIKKDDYNVDFRTCDLEEIIRQTSLRLRSYISHASMIAYSLAHLKPKEIDKFQMKRDDGKNKKDQGKKMKREFVLDKFLYKEKMVLVEIMALLVNIYRTTVLFSDQTKIILLIKQSPLEITMNNEKAEIVIAKNKVHMANINGIIDRLASVNDQDFVDLIVSSFGSFMSSKEFVTKLVERHEKGDNKVKDNVFLVLKNLIYKSFDELTKETEQILLEYFKKSNDKKLNDLMFQLNRKMNIKDLNIAGLLLPPVDFFIPNEPFYPTQFFISCESREIARQLTMIDHALYKKVKRSELFENIVDGVKKQNKICRYYHILEMEQRIDDIANWTATTILMFSDLDNRVSMMLKFIEIARELEELNNYQSLAGICKGFELESIQRLPGCLKQISASYKHLVDISKSLGFNSNSFKGYKATVDKIKDACVPYIIPTRKYIKKAVEKLPATTGTINILQKEEIMNVANKFLRFQQFEYGFSISEPLYTLLFDLSHLPIAGTDVDDSYQRRISYLCED